MGVTNRYNEKEFDAILNKLKSIKDLQEKLNYIDSVKQQYSEIFYHKKGIKLLSSSLAKKFEDFMKRVNKEGNDILNEMRAEGNKNGNNDRSEDDYIQWTGKIKQLRILIKKLIVKGYILEKEVNIERIINDHFYIKDYTVPGNVVVKSIKWNKPIPDLLHLFEKLLVNNLLINFKKARHEIVAIHFMNIDNVNYDEVKLRKYYSKYTKKTYLDKDRFMQLDDIIEEITSEQLY